MGQLWGFGVHEGLGSLGCGGFSMAWYSWLLGGRGALSLDFKTGPDRWPFLP